MNKFLPPCILTRAVRRSPLIPRPSSFAQRAASSVAKRLQVGFLLLSVLAGGCVTRYQKYHQLNQDVSKNDYGEFYQTEINDIKKQASGIPDQAYDFDSDVDQKIMRLKKNWEKAISEVPASISDSQISNEFTISAASGSQLEMALSQAEQRLSDNVDWDSLLSVTKMRNPSIKAARESVKATLEQYPQTAYLDDILQQYNAFTKQLNTKIGSQKQKKMQSMSFPFPDTLALKGQVVSEDVEIAKRKEEITIRDVITEVKVAYFELVYLNDAVRINRENQELLEQILSVAQSKIRVDRANYNSVIMTQVELSKLVDAIITLEDKLETVTARINTLLNRPPQEALGTVSTPVDFEPAMPIDEIYDLALNERQELNVHRSQISRMTLMVDLVKRMTYPDASAGLSYFEDRMRLSSGTDDISPTPFATRKKADLISTPWYGQQDAYIREIELRINSISEKLTAFEDDIRFRIRQEYLGLETAKRSISLYRDTLLPQAYQAMESANTGYQNGKTDFLIFLDSQRTLLKFQLEEQRALRNHRQHLARLDQLVGRTLAKEKLNLQTPQGKKEE